VSLSLKASYTKKNRNYSVGGKLSEGGLPVSGVTVSVLSGSSPTKLVAGRTGTTTSAGAWSAKGKFGARPKKPVYFKATAAVKERDYTATGCQSPLAPTIAPAGCLSATLPPWTATSAVAKIKP
jgi:hypothetical protein